MFTFSESHSVRSGSRLSANKTPLYSENKPSCGQCQLSTLVHQVVDTLSHCALQKSALLLFQAMISLLCFLPLLWYQSSTFSVFSLVIFTYFESHGSDSVVVSFHPPHHCLATDAFVFM